MLWERQRRRIGVDKLLFYDEKFCFPTGNATPRGGVRQLVNRAAQMYREMSPQTNEFFTFMIEHELLELESKKGKASIGYCEFIAKYCAPFIFANFNGTSGDIDVLTHEAGHAFQVYLSRNYPVPEYSFPTMEACEIHSMSMEFFAWPWLELFFAEDAAKYRYAHLTDSLMFLPYAAAVDEFQHAIYQQPEASPAQRKQIWRDLEKVYLPHRDPEENLFLQQGGFWLQQGHIFNSPFYYIDYALAQVCALQFWQKAQSDSKLAWKDFIALCQAGGSMPFTELIKVARLNSPFIAGSVQTVAETASNFLQSVDDFQL
jgi:M3 family oligoendopeptidase